LLVEGSVQLAWVLFSTSVAGLASGLILFLTRGQRVVSPTDDSQEQAIQKRRKFLTLWVSPVFLFNSLHNIAALALVDPAKAGHTAEQLADYIRTVREMGNSEFTLLAQELKCADLYLKIEKSRFAENLQIIQDIDPTCLEIKVPTFILQPIVENAVRHGVELSAEPTQVILSAHCFGTHLILEVTDTGKGISAADIADSVNGPSLSLIRKRLNNHFGKEATLELEALVPNGTRVQLSFPKIFS